jgi:hypothetical protein
LNLGSTAPLRKYLRIVLRDKPVRRSISRIGIPSRKCQRRITLNNAMSITPCRLQPLVGGGSNMGQFSMEIYIPPGSVLSGNQQKQGLKQNLCSSQRRHTPPSRKPRRSKAKNLPHDLFSSQPRLPPENQAGRLNALKILLES